MAARTKTRITREDVEEKLRSLAGDARDEAEAVKPKLVTTGVAVGLVVVLLAYLVGRRSGRKRSAVVEIRRL